MTTSTRTPPFIVLAFAVVKTTMVLSPPRRPRSTLDRTVSAALQIVTTTCRVALPPVVACVRAVTAFYAALPIDALLAQAGLVYCFAGGYFPTLFAALQAARNCGWENAVHAVDDLVDEAVTAIRACDRPPPSEWGAGEEKQHDAKERRTHARQLFTEKTMIVLATIDPMKINQAVAALYTTWMGVSTVLEREFAKTIALSVTIGDYMRPLTNFLLAPPAYLCVPERFHKWVPVVLGWGCKAAAMSVAWRVQRVLTAYSSAVAGGLMFSRSLFRMLRKRGVRLWGLLPKDCEKSSLDEILGLAVAAAGLYSQIGHGFSFVIPFPLSLVTWPFEIAERWIQWAITEDVD